MDVSWSFLFLKEMANCVGLLHILHRIASCNFSREFGSYYSSVKRASIHTAFWQLPATEQEAKKCLCVFVWEQTGTGCGFVVGNLASDILEGGVCPHRE